MVQRFGGVIANRVHAAYIHIGHVEHGSRKRLPAPRKYQLNQENAKVFRKPVEKQLASCISRKPGADIF